MFPWFPNAFLHPTVVSRDLQEARLGQDHRLGQRDPPGAHQVAVAVSGEHGTGLAKVAGWFGVMNHIGIMVNGGKTIKENQRVDIDIDI